MRQWHGTAALLALSLSVCTDCFSPGPFTFRIKSTRFIGVRARECKITTCAADDVRFKALKQAEEAARAAIAASIAEGLAEETAKARVSASAEPAGVACDEVDQAGSELAPPRAGATGGHLAAAEEAARAAVAASLAEGRAEDEKLTTEMAATGAQMKTVVAAEVSDGDSPSPNAISQRVWKLMQDARSSKSTQVLIRAEEKARAAVAASLAQAGATAAKLETASAHAAFEQWQGPHPSPNDMAPTAVTGPASIPFTSFSGPVTDSQGNPQTGGAAAAPTAAPAKKWEPVIGYTPAARKSALFSDNVLRETETKSEEKTLPAPIVTDSAAEALRKAEKAARLRVAVLAAAEAAASQQASAKGLAQQLQPVADVITREEKLLGSRSRAVSLPLSLVCLCLSMSPSVSCVCACVRENVCPSLSPSRAHALSPSPPPRSCSASSCALRTSSRRVVVAPCSSLA